MDRWVKLRDPVGSFRDPETGFSITRDEVKQLSEPWGAITKSWVASRGLIGCEPPSESEDEADETQAPDPPEPEEAPANPGPKQVPPTRKRGR